MFDSQLMFFLNTAIHYLFYSRNLREAEYGVIVDTNNTFGY